MFIKIKNMKTVLIEIKLPDQVTTEQIQDHYSHFEMDVKVLLERSGVLEQNAEYDIKIDGETF